MIHHFHKKFAEEMGYPEPADGQEYPHHLIFVDWNNIKSPENVGIETGAVSFFKSGESFTLDWIWVAPGFRGQGLVTAMWPTLLDKYGDFDISTPISEALKGVIRKVGTVKQRTQAATESYEKPIVLESK